MATRKPTTRKAKVVPNPAFPPTAFQVWWKGVRAEFSAKADRKREFSNRVEINIHSADIPTDGRYGLHIYDAAGYLAAYKAGKASGISFRELLRNATPAKALEFFNNSPSAGKRDELLAKISTEARTRIESMVYKCPSCGKYEAVGSGKQSRFTESWHCRECVGNVRVIFSVPMDDWVPKATCIRYWKTAAAYLARELRGSDAWVNTEWASSQGWMRYNSHAFPPEVWVELGFDENPPDGMPVIGGYHSSKGIVGRIPSPVYDGRKLPLLLGMELEMECNPDYNREKLAAEFLKKLSMYTVPEGQPKAGGKFRYCALERDGSITHGFEMVTGYTGLDVHRAQLAFLASGPFKGRLRSHDTTTCGLHVHIDRNNITPLHADKLNRFINASENRDLVLAVARRYGSGSGYAKIQNKSEESSLMGKSLAQLRATWRAKRRDAAGLLAAMRPNYQAVIAVGTNTDRYQAVNFTCEKTLEFRLFKGTLKYETIMACLEFTRAAWLFSYETSAAQLTTKNFLDFIVRADNRGDTPALRAFLTAKGFTTNERTKLVIPKGRLNTDVLNAEDATEGLVAA